MKKKKRNAKRDGEKERQKQTMEMLRVVLRFKTTSTDKQRVRSFSKTRAERMKKRILLSYLLAPSGLK